MRNKPYTSTQPNDILLMFFSHFIYHEIFLIWNYSDRVPNIFASLLHIIVVVQFHDLPITVSKDISVNDVERSVKRISDENPKYSNIVFFLWMSEFVFAKSIKITNSVCLNDQHSVVDSTSDYNGILFESISQFGVQFSFKWD